MYMKYNMRLLATCLAVTEAKKSHILQSVNQFRKARCLVQSDLEDPRTK